MTRDNPRGSREDKGAGALVAAPRRTEAANNCAERADGEEDADAGVTKAKLVRGR